MLLAILPTPACTADQSSLLKLSERAFDQNVTGGWRALANRGCNREAADLIRRYRLKRRPKNTNILIWHEAQLRATAQQNRLALALFRQSYRKGDTAWNLYVDGTIAFLENDRKRLMASRKALIALPKPKTVPNFEMMGQVVKMPWPPNLNVLDGFDKCFGQTYREAYENCTKPILKYDIPDDQVPAVSAPAVGERHP